MEGIIKESKEEIIKEPEEPRQEKKEEPKVDLIKGLMTGVWE